jgi:hypothetical protein
MEWKNRSAYVFIKTSKGKADDIWKQFQKWDNVIGTWIVTGNHWDVIVWFDAQDWETVHRCVSTIKNWKEVEQTSSHMVYNGHKTDKWWWEDPAGAWVMMRENKVDEAQPKIRNWSWMTSDASIPGEWDYISWVGGKNWNEVWNHLWEIKKGKWETTTHVPIKSWWKESWKENWW